MNFALAEDQRLLADSVGRLFERHAADASRDRLAQWADYRDLGLLALPFGEEVGGLGGGAEEVVLVMEAYGRTLATAPYLQSVLLAGRLLAALSHPAARELLAGVMAGERRAALCLYEPGARYDWDMPSTRAEPDGSGWRLTGAKCAVLDADEGTMLICPAATADGLGLFLVPPDAQGVTLAVRPTPDGRRAADVRLEAVKLPGEAAIGDARRSAEWLAAVIDGAVVAACAEMVGAMQRLLDLTVDYLGTRRQFGAPLGSFQALQHRAADMLVALEQARSIIFWAVSALDRPAPERAAAVAAAKALVNRSARLIGQQAIQLHGGIGLTLDYAAGRYFQRLTVLEGLFGDSDHHLRQVERAGGVPA